MTALENILENATKAKLIPSVADSNQEVRIVSILLATLSVVRPFADRLLNRCGVKMGKKSDLRCYSEVAFPGSDDVGSVRVDGILSLRTGQKRWTAILEAKVENNEIDKDQVLSYARIAREHGIDAVVTLSNQLVPLATHLPYSIPKNIANRTKFLHISWMSLLTDATLILSEKNWGDDITHEQAFILDEMTRYMEHPKSGVRYFDHMNQEWGDLVVGVRNRTKFKKDDLAIKNAISSWHQEERDVCLMLSRRIGKQVGIFLSRKHKEHPELRHQEACANLADSQLLRCAFTVPNAASALDVVADLQRRTICCSMKLSAPTDKRRPSARINWLRSQLKAVDGAGVIVRAIWPGRGGVETEASLSDVQRDTRCLENGPQGTAMTSFEVLMIRDLAGRFSRPRKFIEELEALVPEFYDRIGQHLKRWIPSPPPIEKHDPVRDANVNETSDRDRGDDISQSELDQPTDPFAPGKEAEDNPTRYFDRAREPDREL